MSLYSKRAGVLGAAAVLTLSTMIAAVPASADIIDPGVILVGAGPTTMALSPDGSRLYVGNYTDGSVTVVDTATSTTLATIGGISTLPASPSRATAAGPT